ncbi:MAG: GTPase HflX [Planctomycetota bacterium]
MAAQLHDNQNGLTQERAFLFGLVPHGDARPVDLALRELGALVDTLGFCVVGGLVQHRRSPDQNYHMGRGKLDEILERAKAAQATVLVSDQQLSPSQGRNIEELLEIPTIDRSEVILRIFDTHARTPQARLQVELARLQYQLPRLQRLWTHLERQRGGIGLRGGMGEKQIDVDRSELRSRIARARRKLKNIENQRALVSAERQDQFSMALVGYTNAGKSTLMNQLTAAGVLVEDQLFSTLDTRTRPWRLPGGRMVLVSDTVGFIHDLPHQLVASFHATLEEALHADLLLVVVDASDPGAADQLHTVEEVLEQLGAGDTPRLYALNKTDALGNGGGPGDHSQLAPLLRQAPRAIPISAATAQGLDELVAEVHQHLRSCENTVEILVRHDQGALRSEVRHMASVLDERHVEEGSILQLVVSQRVLGRLLAKGATRLTDGLPS